MLISKWIDRKAVVCPHNGTLLSDKKKWSTDTTTWMGLKYIILGGRNQIIWFMKNFSRCKLIHRNRKQISGCPGIGDSRRERPQRGRWDLSRVMDIYCLECGDVFTGLSTCQTFLSVHFTYVQLIIWWLYLNKGV